MSRIVMTGKRPPYGRPWPSVGSGDAGPVVTRGPVVDEDEERSAVVETLAAEAPVAEGALGDVVDMSQWLKTDARRGAVRRGHTSHRSRGDYRR